MRSYGQYCGVAKALDVLGERWTLLIVRELLIRGPSRYTDLRHGLPGIATNLLAARLRELEEAGIVQREDAPPPVATTLFELTERGKALEPILHELGRWAGPLLALPAEEDSKFNAYWLALPARLHLTDAAPGRRPGGIQIRGGAEPLVIGGGEGEVHTRVGQAEEPDLTLDGPPHLLVGLLLGRIELAQARAGGLSYEGDPKVLRRIRPRAAQSE